MRLQISDFRFQIWDARLVIAHLDFGFLLTAAQARLSIAVKNVQTRASGQSINIDRQIASGSKGPKLRAFEIWCPPSIPNLQSKSSI
jgi:hypothetical protein